MAGEDSSGRTGRRPGDSPSSSEERSGNNNPNDVHGHVGNPPSTPDSPTSVGFNTDQLPFNTTSRTSDNYSDEDDEEAAVDPHIIRDDDEEIDEEEEGEDLFNDNYMESVTSSLNHYY